MKIKSKFVKAFLLGLGITYLSSGAAFASTEETNAAEPVDATILMAGDSEPVKAPSGDGDAMVITNISEPEEIMYKDPNAATSSNPNVIATAPDDLKRDLDGSVEPAMDPSIYETGVAAPAEDGEVKATGTISQDDRIRTLAATNADDGTPEGAKTMTAAAARDFSEDSAAMNYIYVLGALLVLAVASFTMRGRIVSGKK